MTPGDCRGHAVQRYRKAHDIEASSARDVNFLPQQTRYSPLLARVLSVSVKVQLASRQKAAKDLGVLDAIQR